MGRSRVGVILLGLCCLFLVGCTQETVVGTGTMYSYQWWVSPLCILIGVGCTLFSIANLSSGWQIWIFLIGSIAGTVCLAPFGFFDKLVVDDTHIEGRWGFWMSPTRVNVAFADIGAAQKIVKTGRGRRGRKTTSYYLMLQTRTGKTEELSLGNSLVKAGLGKIQAGISAKGGQIQDLTGGM